MIPYFDWDSVSLSHFSIRVTTLGLGAGLFFAWHSMKRLGAEHHLDRSILSSMALSAMLGGFLGSRLIYVLMYQPWSTWEHPGEFFRFSIGGMSEMGAVLGGIAGAYLYLRARKVNVISYMDILFFAAPIGLALTRLGLFLSHEFLGAKFREPFLLAFQSLDGYLRHDLSLYFFLSYGLCAGFYWYWKKRKVPAGWYAVVFLFWFGLSRSWFDFFFAWRGSTAAVRYFEMTPTQYLSWFLLLAGLLMLIWIYEQREPQTEKPPG